MTSPTPLSRQGWMRLLALAPEKMLQEHLAPLAQKINYVYLRKPELGLLMLEGKTQATRFNLGEMLVTRCSIRLHEPKDVQGFSWIAGNRPEHAFLAALGDALMQVSTHADALHRGLFAAIRTYEKKRALLHRQKFAPSRVQFFTMVRGEDA